MAGFSKIYCIGGLGGFQGADGINPIRLQIWVGDADRQWFEAHYIDEGLRPLGGVEILIPERPDHPDALIDACLAFYPEHFQTCSTLPMMEQRLAGVARMDFDMGGAEIPKEWPKLRQEAWPLFRKLNIFEAQLRRLEIREESL